MKAIRITRYTLMAFNNCFSVEGDDGHQYRIVNFYVECLQNLPIEWPIEIKVLEGNVAVIHDDRIPNRFYNKTFCTTCCPKHLLPITQKLEREREISRGQRVEHENSNSVTIHFSKSPTMKLIDPNKHVDGRYYDISRQ